MKISQVKSVLLLISVFSFTSVIAKDCVPPSGGGNVSFTFEANGNTCTFEKKIIKTIRAGGFDYSSGGATANNYYYRASYGCDSEGNWGVDKNNPLQCEPLENCLEESNIDFSLVENQDNGKVNCKVSTGAVPKLASGEEFQFQHGIVRCFHRRLTYKPASYPFKCPVGTIIDEDEVANIDSENSNARCESKKELVFYAKDRDGNNCQIKHQSLPTLNNGSIASSDGTPGRIKCSNGNYEVDSAVKFTCPSDSIVADNYTGEEENDSESSDSTDGESPDLLAEGYGANEQITAAAAAFGAGMTEKCEAGSKVKSFNTFSAAFKKYHALVIANVDIHEKGLLRMEERAKQLVEETKNNQSLLVQVESLNFQRDSMQLMIDLYMDKKTGTYTGKLDLLTQMSQAQEESLSEFKAMNKSILICDGQTSSALEIARVGCERTKLVETCNEDGSECEDLTEADPVEGSCLALEMIPQSLKLKEDLYNLQFEVMPSNLLVTGQENVTKNYIRYVTTSLPKGDWQAPLINCGKVLDQTHINYGVKCETPQGDLANSEKWDMPIQGSLVTDLYAGILDRLPDNGGNYYWQKKYDDLIAEGKSAEDAAIELRHHISSSNENKGLEATQEEIEQRKKYNIEHNLQEGSCKDVSCGSLSTAESSVDVDKWYSSIEEEARFKDLVNSEDQELNVEDLKKLAFDKFEKGDLIVGAPYGRMQLTPQMNELITQSIKEDLKVVETLTKNKNELVTMLNNLKTESGSSADGSSNSSGFGSGVSGSASLSTIDQTTQALSEIDTDSLYKSVADANAISDKLNNETDGALKKFEPPKSILAKSNALLEEIKLSNKAASRGSFNNTAKINTFTNSSANKANQNNNKNSDESVTSLDLNKQSRSNFARTQNNSAAVAVTDSNEAIESVDSHSSDNSFSNGLTAVDFSDFDDNSVIPIHARDKVKKSKRISKSKYSNSGRMPSSATSSYSRKNGKSASGRIDSSSPNYKIERGNTYSIDSSEINKADTSLFKIISKRYSSTKLYPKK